MRPIRLVVSAFGPYINEQDLDFTILQQNPLFLLSGPTGSGKTMLLDAMCYALFGECSGEARKAPSVRSQHATPDQLTRVTFDFALGPEVYRVQRSPEQDRAKLRGTGTVRMAAQATLWRRMDAASDEDGEMLAAQPQKVTESIEAILGFTSVQFRQVVVLPQGEFKRFLEARSGDRETILEVLFQTSEYRRIEEALTSRAASVEREAHSKADQRNLILQQAGAESRENLQSAIEKLVADEASKQAEEGHLRIAAESARTAVESARDQDRRLKELRAAEAAYDELAKDCGINEARQREVALAHRAARVMPFELEATTRQREALEAGEKAESANRELNEAAAEEAEARRALEQEESRQPECEQAAREVQRLEGLRNRVRELEIARADHVKAQQAVMAAGNKAGQADADLNDCLRAVDAKRCEQEQALEQAEPVARLTVEEQRLTLLHRTRKELEADESKLAQSSRALAEARRDRAKAEEALDAARGVSRETEQHWIDGQAALLAQQLSPGEPCPVCGSAVHPVPAVATDPLPSEAALKHARAEVERQQEECARARDAEKVQEITVGGIEAAISRSRAKLGDAAETSAREIEVRLTKVQRELSEAKAAAERARQAKADLDNLGGSERMLREKRDAADNESRSAAMNAASCRTLFLTREAEIPEALRPAGVLDKTLREAQTLVNKLDAALKNARERAGVAGNRLAAARERAEGAREAAKRAKQAAERKEKAFAAARAGAGFAIADEYRTAVRSEGQLDSLEHVITQFNSDFAAADSRLKRAREDAAGIRQPDIAALEEAARQAASRLEACVSELTALSGKISLARRQLADLDAVCADYERLEKRYRMVAHIADTANGRNAVKVNFQRFVQATLLDRVLEAATERLRIMSRGRYELQRAAGTLDRRSSAGLDLEVFDAHTGAARPVSTLSGGESFQASLALALGLAGVVQSHSGGVRLESIFIDEGFGSLDADALALAVDTLRDLQQGGRLIGIVSHVAELKEQIPARLEVTPGHRGSDARFALS